MWKTRRVPQWRLAAAGSRRGALRAIARFVGHVDCEPRGKSGREGEAKMQVE